jgi:hypothetical protein
MNVQTLPEFKSQLDAAAALLAKSLEDSTVIEGAENKILVKTPSTLGRQMIDGNRVLFTHKVGETEYLVCIKEVR